MELIRRFLEDAGEGLMEWNLQTGRVTYSDRWKAILGFEPFELDDSPALWLELSHPADRIEADKKFLEHMDGDWPFVHTWRLQHKNGTWRWLLGRAATVHSNSGRAENILVVFSDISERVLAERRLHTLVEALPDMLLRISKDNLILDGKLPQTAASDASPPAAGDSAEAWLAGQGLTNLLDLISHVRSSGKASSGVVRTERSPGREYEAYVVLGIDEEVVCILRDVTERRNLEAQVQQTQRLESIGQLAAGIAHEINTPVQFVSDSVHFLKDAFQDISTVLVGHQAVRSKAGNLAIPAELKAAFDETAETESQCDLAYLVENAAPAIDRVLDGLDRIATIVRSIKEFAHPSTAEQVMTDINRSVMTTLTIARSEYKYSADLETELGELPMVPCFPGDVNQAILNIVVNASHAIADKNKGTENKGVITVRTRIIDGFAEIAIADTGGGIPEHIHDRIFDPFFTTKEVGKGTGQGLAISRATIVNRHKGTLTFETQMGVGTTFFIRLPLAHEASVDMAS